LPTHVSPSSAVKHSPSSTLENGRIKSPQMEPVNNHTSSNVQPLDVQKMNLDEDEDGEMEFYSEISSIKGNMTNIGSEVIEPNVNGDNKNNKPDDMEEEDPTDDTLIGEREISMTISSLSTSTNSNIPKAATPKPKPTPVS
jgi:hypothetical protein